MRQNKDGPKATGTHQKSGVALGDFGTVSGPTLNPGARLTDQHLTDFGVQLCKVRQIP